MAYLDSDEERIQTILSGLPISAENLRLSQFELGEKWHGTSWFFLMHLIAKTFTRVDKIPFSSIVNIPRNFGIENWVDPPKLHRQLRTLTRVFNKRELGNVEIDEDGNLSIGSVISPGDLKKFAENQYQYSMGEGLTRYSRFNGWTRRSPNNFAERIWWHYNTAVFKKPRIFSTPEGGSYLDALLYGTSNKLSERKLNYNGVEIWKSEHFDQIQPSLIEWQREMLSKQIIKTMEIEDTHYIAPRYFAEKIEVKSKDNMETISKLLENLYNYPSYPIYNGSIDNILMAKELERSNFIIKITEPDAKYDVPQYSYIVPWDIAQKVEKEINYSYSQNPISEHGDTTLTDQIFLSMGRARLFAEGIDPSIRLLKKDFKKRIDEVINSLLDKGESDITDVAFVFDPLTTLDILEFREDRKKCVLNSDFDFVIKTFADAYYNIINEPDLITLELPNNQLVDEYEMEYTTEQIKKSILSQFGF